MIKRMMKRAAATGLILFAAAGQLHAGPRLTLYFPFDGNLVPQTVAARTEFKLEKPAPAASYVEGVKGQAVLLNGNPLWGPTAGNLAGSQGTLCFWAKPVEWDPQQPETVWRTFWMLNANAPGTPGSCNDYVSFWRYSHEQSKPFNSIGAYNYAAQAQALSNMIFDIKDWKRGEWRFFTMSWGRDGSDKFYQNGELAGGMLRTRESLSTNLNYLLIIGAGSALDEFKVFDTQLADEEVRQEYQGKSVAVSAAKTPAAPCPLLADMLTLVGAQPDDELRIKPGDKVSFMGDSITQAGGYLRVAAHVLKATYPNLNLPPFTNAGISGNKAENMAPRFAQDMKLSDKPAWVFISVGVNDVGGRLKDEKNNDLPHDPKVMETYETNVRKMVEMGQAAGARIVLLTPTLLQEDPNTEGNKRLLFYVEAMKRIAVEKKCAVIDFHDLFLKALANRKTPVKLTSDGVHMTVYGDVIMAIGVLRAMGVSDSAIAATDVAGIIQFNGLRRAMPLSDASDLLEVPVARLLAKPELLSLLSF